MSSCGGFYGRLDSLVCTPTTSQTPHNNAHNSQCVQRSLTNPSSSSTPVILSRSNNRVLEEKVDEMFLALEEQKKENSAILSQLKSLQETVDQSVERASTENVKKRIPFSLSVSGGVMLIELNVIKQEKVREIHSKADQQFDGSQL